MMAKKKINPRRRPLSEADVPKIQHQSIHLAFAIFLCVLKDKFLFDNDQIVKAWEEADKLSQEVNEGRINLNDLVSVLEDEYHVILRR